MEIIETPALDCTEVFNTDTCRALLQKLKQLGPLKEGDQRLVANLSQEGRRLVMEKKGMINFLKVRELVLCL